MSLDVLVSKLWFCLCVLWQTSKSFLCSCRVSPGRSVCKSKSEKVLHHKTPQTENSPQLEVSYKSPTCFTILTFFCVQFEQTVLELSWPSHLGHAVEIRFWEFPNNPFFMVAMQRLSCWKIRVNSNRSNLERSNQILDLESNIQWDLGSWVGSRIGSRVRSRIDLGTDVTTDLGLDLGSISERISAGSNRKAWKR